MAANIAVLECILTIFVLIVIVLTIIHISVLRDEIKYGRAEIEKLKKENSEKYIRAIEAEHALEQYRAKQSLTAAPVKPETKAARKMNWSQIRHFNDAVNHREREHAERKADNTAYEEE